MNEDLEGKTWQVLTFFSERLNSSPLAACKNDAIRSFDMTPSLYRGNSKCFYSSITRWIGTKMSFLREKVPKWLESTGELD